jgi:hypothetical protein
MPSQQKQVAAFGFLFVQLALMFLGLSAAFAQQNSGYQNNAPYGATVDGFKNLYGNSPAPAADSCAAARSFLLNDPRSAFYVHTTSEWLNKYHQEAYNKIANCEEAKRLAGFWGWKDPNAPTVPPPVNGNAGPLPPTIGTNAYSPPNPIPPIDFSNPATVNIGGTDDSAPVPAQENPGVGATEPNDSTSANPIFVVPLPQAAPGPVQQEQAQRLQALSQVLSAESSPTGRANDAGIPASPEMGAAMASVDSFDKTFGLTPSANAGNNTGASREMATAMASVDSFDRAFGLEGMNVAAQSYTVVPTNSVDDPSAALTDRKIADNADIQGNSDPNSPVTFTGVSSQDAMQRVIDGQAKQGDFLRPELPGIPAQSRVLILKVTKDVSFTSDHSMMYVGQDLVYQVPGQQTWRVSERVIPMPVLESERTRYSNDKNFVLAQTWALRSEEARAYPPDMAPEIGAPAGVTILNAMAPALNFTDAAASDEFSRDQWIDPYTGKWAPFPKPLADAGFQPGPGGLRASAGIQVFLGNQQVPDSWWGGDVGKDVRGTGLMGQP